MRQPHSQIIYPVSDSKPESKNISSSPEDDIAGNLQSKEHFDKKPNAVTNVIRYLKNKLYDKALRESEKAIEYNSDNSEMFLYAAICLLKGQKAFVVGRTTIEKIEEYINMAIMIEPRGVYYYFLAYIKYDYYNRKCINTSPTYQEALIIANSSGVFTSDIAQLFDIIGIDNPF